MGKKKMSFKISFSGNSKKKLQLITQKQTKVINSCTKFDNNWLKADPVVLVLAFLGWTIPSSIPVSGFGNESLFQKFTSSIGTELAHFPTGPSIDSEFWLYLCLYHVGLFSCMLLGQIGVQGRKQGLFKQKNFLENY